MKSIFKYSAVAFLLFCALGVNSQKISLYLVGTNVWYIDPSDEVWKLTKECGVTTVRIGGHAYDKKLPSNETLLNWVRKIQSMGAEPIMQVPQYQSAEVAANLVRFFNVEKHEGISPIKFWNIGNEPWLQANRPDLATFAPKVEEYFKPIAAAMKAVDPTIKIYGPDFCDYLDAPINDLFGGKNDITGKVPGKNYYYCDGLAWHRYPQGSGDLAVQGADDMLKRIVKSKVKVDQIYALHKRKENDAFVWAIGEYNGKGGAEVHTWGNGQMFAAVLGWCMEYGAKYATSWSMFEHAGDRKGSDFSFIDGKNMTPRASYQHMKFVAQNFSGEYLKGTASDSSFIVYGSQNGKQVSVMIMNRAFGEPKDYTLSLNDSKNNGVGITLMVNAKRKDVYKDVIQPRSTQVIIFKANSISKINYTSDDFDNERPPVYSVVKK